MLLHGQFDCSMPLLLCQTNSHSRRPHLASNLCFPTAQLRISNHLCLQAISLAIVWHLNKRTCSGWQVSSFLAAQRWSLLCYGDCTMFDGDIMNDTAHAVAISPAAGHLGGRTGHAEQRLAVQRLRAGVQTIHGCGAMYYANICLGGSAAVGTCDHNVVYVCCQNDAPCHCMQARILRFRTAACCCSAACSS